MATTTTPVSVPPRTGGRTSSVLVRFTPASNVTTDQYDETIRRPGAARASAARSSSAPAGWIARVKMPVDDIARTETCVLVPPAGQCSSLGIRSISSSFALPFYGWLVFARPPSTRKLQFRYKSKERVS